MKKINLACIVEDDPIHLFLTQKYLGLTGMVEKILVCNNGKEAFELMESIIQAHTPLPELILLDLNMPVWDGWQFLEEFTKIPVDQKITIYILTSSDNPDDLARAEEYNLKSNYLVKPVTIEMLKSALEQALA